MLAYDRTEMAHERTFLAYLRTALTAAIAGITFIKFLAAPWATQLGWFLIGVGVITMVVGLARLRRLRRLQLDR